MHPLTFVTLGKNGFNGLPFTMACVCNVVPLSEYDADKCILITESGRSWDFP